MRTFKINHSKFYINPKDCPLAVSASLAFDWSPSDVAFNSRTNSMLDITSKTGLQSSIPAVSAGSDLYLLHMANLEKAFSDTQSAVTLSSSFTSVPTWRRYNKVVKHTIELDPADDKPITNKANETKPHYEPIKSTLHNSSSQWVHSVSKDKGLCDLTSATF